MNDLNLQLTPVDCSVSTAKAAQAAAIALLDELLLMRQLVGPKVADRATKLICKGVS